jgi:glycerol-3-phosphate acyltransferase PlsX
VAPRIVVDAMGGDHAPEVVVEGAVHAARAGGVSLVLTGPEARIRPLATRFAGGEAPLQSLPIRFVDAPEVIGMEEQPVAAIRRKKQSSILVGLRLVRDNEADAFVSAGNTGAIMAAATLVLGRLPGVERPALAALLPTKDGTTVLVDVGANLDVKPQHLEQFAIMGACLMRAVRGIENPRVALLSIGEEEGKGNELLRRVHQDLKRAPVNFVGNVDGKDVFSGHADVIVTDGFTGNAILKSCESLVKELFALVRREIDGSLMARAGVLLMGPTLRRIGRRMDHSEHGGVPLLGVARPVFIGHGSSSAKSIRSAIFAAATFAERRVNEAIEEQVRQLALVAQEDGPAGEPHDAVASGDARKVRP